MALNKLIQYEDISNDIGLDSRLRYRVLYGRGSPGGFVNRVRKKPLPEFHAEVAPSVGSFDFYRIEGDITDPLFDSDAARGRMVVAAPSANARIEEELSELARHDGFGSPSGETI